MNKIKTLRLYNSPYKDVESVISLDQSKNILILTGYNGSGKTRILNMIHESISLVRDYNYETPYSQWLAEIVFSGDIKDIRLRTFKLERHTPEKDSDDTKLNNLLSSGKSLPEIFNKARTLVSSKKATELMRKAKDNDALDVICVAGLHGIADEAETFKNNAESVLFIDDKLFFSYKRELDELVFDSSPNIDKTLYILINEFVSSVAKSAIPEITEELVGESIKKILEKILLDKDAKKIENIEDIKNHVKLELAQNLASQGISFVGNSDFFEKVNRFFSQTKRSLVWDEKRFFISRLDDGSEVSWIEFSKGEKTLIAIMLITFLYKDRALFLFDEPDLSLHIEWQEMLLTVLREIAPNAQFIIATHSPALILNTDAEQVVNLARLGRKTI